MQGKIKDLIYILADLGLGLVSWRTNKPFVNVNAPMMPLFRLDALIPKEIRDNYINYLTDKGQILDKENYSCLEWCKNLPMGCMQQKEVSIYLPQQHNNVMALLNNAKSTISNVMDKDKPRPAGDANHALS